MAYCSQSDILNLISEVELAELTAESGETPDAEVVAEGITKAAAEIDAYCGVRYAVPFSEPVPAMVKSLAVDMAIYHIFSRRDLLLEGRRRKYEDAIRFLIHVSAGRVSLGESAAPPAAVGQEVVEISSSERVFSRERMKDW